ncbi:MAG: prephenate dehydratase [bacterium]|nr:prephenate dehydratase [bacterium]MDD5757155.1 prephenate dehydratase [bacterium]
MDLKKLRNKIDKLDVEILDLLNERLKIARQVGKAKKLRKEDVYAPNREKEILINLIKKNKGPLPTDELKNIFREIIKTSLLLQKKLSIAYLGPEASFTHLAGIKNFGRQAQYVPAKSIGDVFNEVEKGRADYGVVPVENTTEGMVNYTLDMFMDSDLKICAEVLLEVHHNLASRTTIDKIEKIYSHVQTVAQCRNYLEEKMSQVKVIEVESNSKAAQLASQDPKSAAIVSTVAAEMYNLNILVSRIEDLTNNYTRFLVIGKNDSAKSNEDKTSILFSIKDRVGALYDMLLPFRAAHINLTKIESRPTKKKAWEYVFFVDLIGHREDANIKKALNELEKECLFLKVLGSYPIGEE